MSGWISPEYFLVPCEQVRENMYFVPVEKVWAKTRALVATDGSKHVAGYSPGMVFYYMDDEVLKDLYGETIAYLQQEIDFLKQELENV